MARFESEEKAKEYIDKLEQTLKSYDDEIFNINLENNIKETKQQIQDQDNKEIFDNFMEDLGKELFK